MSKSYPIWNRITACIYKGSKCYGVQNDGLNEILIGTSKSNSHEFVRTSNSQETRRRQKNLSFLY